MKNPRSLKHLTGNQLDPESQVTLGIQVTRPEECQGSPGPGLGPDPGLGPEVPCQDTEAPGSDPGPEGPVPGPGQDPEGLCPEGQGPDPVPDIS